MFVGIKRGAGGLERAIDPVGRLADDLELIDGISFSRSVEQHGQPLTSFSTAPSVRSTNGTLNAFSRVGLASASNRAATALAPRGISASAASMRHGLCATPPSAMRPEP